MSLPRASDCRPAPISFGPVSGPEFDLWCRRYVTAQKQPGLYSILIPIFLGNLTNQNTLALADFLAPFGEDVLRATIDQNLSLRNIPSRSWSTPRIHKSITDLASGPRFLGSSVACTGASTCKIGICLPRGALTAVVQKLKDFEPGSGSGGGSADELSGCPNTCGAHLAADLGFFGKVARKGQTPIQPTGLSSGADWATAQPGLRSLPVKSARGTCRCS